MRNLTLANQLTILRILIAPFFVILVVYGMLGAALLAFIVAGITDALDGLIARRAGQRTSLGAWLDPMADKLLLVTTFVVLTIPTIPGPAGGGNLILRIDTKDAATWLYAADNTSLIFVLRPVVGAKPTKPSQASAATVLR